MKRLVAVGLMAVLSADDVTATRSMWSVWVSEKPGVNAVPVGRTSVLVNRAFPAS